MDLSTHQGLHNYLCFTLFSLKRTSIWTCTPNQILKLQCTLNWDLVWSISLSMMAHLFGIEVVLSHRWKMPVKSHSPSWNLFGRKIPKATNLAKITKIKSTKWEVMSSRCTRPQSRNSETITTSGRCTKGLISKWKLMAKKCVRKWIVKWLLRSQFPQTTQLTPKITRRRLASLGR